VSYTPGIPQPNITTVVGTGNQTPSYQWRNRALGYNINDGVGSEEGMRADRQGNLLFWDGNSISVDPAVSGELYGQAMTAGRIYQIAGNETGNGQVGNEIPATSAILTGPGMLAVDPEDNILLNQGGALFVIAESTTNPGYDLPNCPGGQCVWVPWDIYEITGGGGTSGDGGPALAAATTATAVVADAKGNVLLGNSSYSEGSVRVIAVGANPGYVCSPSCATWTNGYIYTIAGYSGCSGGDGQSALSAGIDYIEGLVPDNKGNLLIDDYDGNGYCNGQRESAIRLVALSSTNPGYQCSPSCAGSNWTIGFIYTIAGGHTDGYGGDGGVSTSATLYYPIGIAVDAAGNVIDAEWANDRVRVIAVKSNVAYGLAMTGGDIYTVTGNGTLGFTTGPAQQAEISGPEGVATTPTGQLVFLDEDNHRVREVGNGPPSLIGVTPQGGSNASSSTGHGSPNGAKCTCAVGEPINVSTGDFYDTHIDLTIPGAGVPLGFTRTYDASVAQGGINDAGMGPGWTSNFSMNVSNTSGAGFVQLYDANGNLDTYPTIGSAVVTDENGAQDTFNEYAQNTAPIPGWCTSDALGPVFCPNAPRILASLTQSTSCATGAAWQLVRQVTNPVTFCFNVSGSLIQIADQNNDRLAEAAYSPGSGQQACPGGDTCTAWTSSVSGRSLVLAVNASSQLVDVFDAAMGGQAASLSYSGCGPVEVCSMTDPGSSTPTTFAYYSGTYNMETMVPPDGATVTNTYNASGQISEQSIAGQTTQTTDYSYVSNSSLPNGVTTTVTTYPNGKSGTGSTTATYQSSNDVLVSETDGAGGTTYAYPDSASLLPSAMVDADGNAISTGLQDYNGPSGTTTSSANAVSSMDALGNTTETQFTSFNQPWCHLDAANELNIMENNLADPCAGTEPTSPPAAGTGASTSYVGATITYYDQYGHVVASTNPLGYTNVTAYTAQGLPYCTVDAFEYSTKGITCPTTPPTTAPTGTATGYTTKIYAPNGDLLSTTDPDGGTAANCYFWENGSGQCASGASGGTPEELYSTTELPEGKTTSYAYDAVGQVTKSVETFGTSSATTLNGYDTDGRPYCTITPLAYAQGTTSCVSPPPSATTLASADAPGSKADPWGGQSITIYDSGGQVSDEVNPLGGVTQYAYDGQANKYCTVKPSAYDQGTTCPALPITTPTPGNGNDPYLGATIDQFDGDGRVVQETNPLGGIVLTQYDPAGNVVLTTTESNDGTNDPNVVTSTSYDQDNRAASTTTDPGGSLSATTEQAYDPNGNTYCSESANATAQLPTGCQAVVWQPGWITAPPNPATEYPSPANDVTLSFTDADGNQVQSTNPDVQTTLTAYDADGRSYCTVDATNDAGGVTCPAPGSPHVTGTATTSFDPAGRTVSSTDQVGDITTTAFDPNGNKLSTTNPGGAVTTNCYYFENGSGQCAASAPSGGGSASELYAQTTPATSVDPTGETTSYTYYPGDQVDVTTDPAGQATDTYDPAGDLVSTSYSGTATGYAVANNVSNTYYPDGSRDTMTDGTGTTTYTYDNAGDVTEQQFAASAAGLSSKTVNYGYFSTGTLSSVTYPSYGSYSSPQATYTYDALGNMTQETDWLGNTVAFSHDLNGNLTSQNNAVSSANPSGTSSTTFAYDAANQTTQATSTLAQSCGGSETLTQSFGGTGGSLNANGQLTQSLASYTGSCSGQTSVQRNYGYDAAGRVVYQGSSPQGSSPNNLAYDPAGDPTQISSHDSTGSFDTYAQTYDGAGEVQSQSPVTGSAGVGSSYGYDSLGDQTSVTSGGSADTYQFNQAGKMTTTSLPGQSSNYLYTGDGLEAAAQRSILAWGPATSIDGSNTLEAVSCPTSSFCMAVDNKGNALKYNGTSWSTPASIDGTQWLDSVSCPSSSLCIAVDKRGYETTYNGTSWSTPSDIDSNKVITSVSCPTSAWCMAVDSSGRALTYNGTSWTSAASIDGTNALESVSCPTTTFCAAVDGTSNTLTYNGTSWTVDTNADHGFVIKSVSCPTATFCIAVDAAGEALTYNGTSWSSRVDINGGFALDGVSCATPTMCEAVDASGGALAFDGTTWSSRQDVDGSHALNAVSCPSTSFCAALDGYALVLAYTTHSWKPATSIDSWALQSASCPSASFCAAGDNDGKILTYDGTAWSSSVVDSSHTVDAVSCPSSSFCAAVDNDGHALIYNGTSWTSATSIDGTRVLDAISCPTSSFCAAVDSSGYAVTYNGTSWSSASAVDTGHALESVSCVSASFCAATDNHGRSLTYNGSWSAATTVDGTSILESVSCPSLSFCVAVDNGGHALTYNGTSWSSAVAIDGTSILESVSCPSVSLCEAVDNTGNVLTYNATGWSHAQDIDGSRSLRATSCPTPDFCLGVDTLGDAVLYGLVTTSSQLTWDTNGSLPTVLSDGQSDYLYGPLGAPMEQVNLSNSIPTFMTYAPSDSAWLTTNAAGDETGFWFYDAFGTLATGAPTSAFGFAGEYTDTTTGLTNLRARWYESQTGGFTSRDPVFASTDEAYTYAGDDPVNGSDPSGLMPNPLPAYCSWAGFNCSSTADGWALESQWEPVAQAGIGGGTVTQYRVYPPQGASSPIAYRNYDLYNPTYNNGRGMAWELKVGTQSQSQTNVNQISFDETLLLNYSADYSHGGQWADVSRILWWEQPRTGGDAGLSAPLAQRLQNAVDATNQRFTVEVDFPEDNANSGAGQSPPSGGSFTPGFPAKVPIDVPVEVGYSGSSSSCGTYT